MHFGSINEARVNTINFSRVLGIIGGRRDLGAHIHKSLKMAAQIGKVVK